MHGQIVTLSPDPGTPAGFGSWAAGRRDLSPYAQPPEDNSGVIAHTPDPTKYHFTADGSVMLPRAKRGRDSGGSRGFQVSQGIVNIDPAEPQTGRGGVQLDVRELSKVYPRLLPKWIPAEGNGFAPPPEWSARWVQPDEVQKYANVFRGTVADEMPPLPAIPALDTWSTREAAAQQTTTQPQPQFQPQPVTQAGSPVMTSWPGAEQLFNQPQIAVPQLPTEPQRHPNQLTPPAWDGGQQAAYPQAAYPQPSYPQPPAGVAPPGFTAPHAPGQSDQLAKLAATVDSLARIVAAGQASQPAAPVAPEGLPASAPHAARPASAEEIGLPFLTSPPSPPTIKVVFDLGAGGRHAKRYHHVSTYNNVLHLMLDTRASVDEFLPPATRPGGDGFKITLADTKEELVVYNPDAHCRLGCVDILTLIIADPEAVRAAKQVADANQPIISEDDPWRSAP